MQTEGDSHSDKRNREGGRIRGRHRHGDRKSISDCCGG